MNILSNDGVPFGVDANGQFRDVSTVERGLRCGCFCPDCRGPLVAKKGPVTTHHFAHHDRRECRHALEASLLGMLLTVLRKPGMTLMLPPCGDRHSLARTPWHAFVGPEATEFFRTPFVIEERVLDLAGAEIARADLRTSSPERPEIQTEKVAIHVLSHRKGRSDVEKLSHAANQGVLTLDLRKYAERWWTVCDASKDETLEHAKTATGLLEHWLRRTTVGREWLYHPELETREEELRRYITAKLRPNQPVGSPVRRFTAEPPAQPRRPLPEATEGPAVLIEDGVPRLQPGRLRAALEAAVARQSFGTFYLLVLGSEPSGRPTREDLTVLFRSENGELGRGDPADLRPGVPVFFIYPTREGVMIEAEAIRRPQLLLR